LLAADLTTLKDAHAIPTRPDLRDLFPLAWYQYFEGDAVVTAMGHKRSITTICGSAAFAAGILWAMGEEAAATSAGFGREQLTSY
jgi:hypothetical protein